MAIAATILRDVDVYFFDEPSSYLDIHERMRIVRIIQALAETKRKIVIEHDLAVLDVLADLIHIVYGKKGAFGIFTPARSTRQAINSYLDGFLPEENVRIRDKPIKFLRHRDRSGEIGTPVVSWGGLEKHLGEFKLTSGEGAVHRSEVVGVVGSNGTGKSTMIKILAGEHEYDAGWATAEATISYKPQHIDVDIDGSVQLWLDSELGPRWRSGEFNVNVIKALGIGPTFFPSAPRNSPVVSGKPSPSPFAWAGRLRTCTCWTNPRPTLTPTRGWRRRRRFEEPWRRTKNQRSSSTTTSTSLTSFQTHFSSLKVRAVWRVVRRARTKLQSRHEPISVGC